MPLLDVNDALALEMLDTFDVERRPEVVDTSGRSTVPKPQTIPNVAGVVAMAGPDDLERLDDQDRMGKVISVVTAFRLRGPSKNKSGADFKPDHILWDGGRYVIIDLQPYHRYGRGFVQALAGSVKLLDRPPG